MNHDEQRVWLIKELQKTESQLSTYPIPQDEQGQKNLLRGLMNIWVPRPLPEEFLAVQDSYLTEEARRRGITDIRDLVPLTCDERLYLWKGDITTLKVGAITNPANSQLLGCWGILHDCADNLIHSAAGLSLRWACYELMSAQGHDEPTGQAKITPGYNLPASYVLHTVGPIVQGSLTEEHERLLASCYTSCLDLAVRNQVESIAFCCISTGVFMFPNQRAAEIAISTVKDWLDRTGSSIKVVFDVYGDKDLRIYQELLAAI